MRNKVFLKTDIPDSVIDLVVAVCSDYSRRTRALNNDGISTGQRELYIRLNSAVDNALDNVEIGLRNKLLDDIIRGRGFNKSNARVSVCKSSYYARKRLVIESIAKNLYLV